MIQLCIHGEGALISKGDHSREDLLVFIEANDVRVFLVEFVGQ